MDAEQQAWMVFLTCTPCSWTSWGSRLRMSWTRLRVSSSAVFTLVPILKITVTVSAPFPVDWLVM